MKPNILTIPASAAFAETLARGLIARLNADCDPLALSRATIYLPTRRATRMLAESFARLLGGAALLPDIRPLGDVDEDDFLFDPYSENLDLPPAIQPVRRQLLLAILVQRWDITRRGGKLTFAQAAALARGLAKFLDEAETQSADLSKLESLAPDTMAEHWAEVKDFLQLLRDQWPGLLEAEKAMNRAAHRNASLAALARRLAERPPTGPVIAAGSTGSIPATAQLLGTIARLPEGAVVLPGLDRELDEESWAELDPGHPQYGMKQLLERIGSAREDVRDWAALPVTHARETLLRETLRPAPTTDAWRALADRGAGDIAQGLEGLSLVEAAHPGEEAAAIALMLREVLETPARTAALVTPDRNLARRVATELRRWNIEIDDSAGRPLSHTPPGTFLCLLAEAADAQFAPVPLLALLKHPFAAGGVTQAEFRRHVRQLDRFCLRGPKPDAGLDGITKAILRASAEARSEDERKIIGELNSWFAEIAKILKPLEKLFGRREIAVTDAIAMHAGVAENLAADATDSNRLWRGDAGEAAATLIAEISEAAADLPNIDASSYGALFRELAAERAIRPAYGRHPRLAILGPLEARLQSFDLVVLSGLNEGTWPPAAATDAWLSRPMRKALGLEQPERAIGLAAHDFATLAAAPRVVLTRALKTEGSPTIASRWLQRLTQLTKGLKLDAMLAPETSYAALAAIMDEPQAPKGRIKRPAPRPPVADRPRRLSVTEIETWLRDPYAIYAKHILKLRPLDPLDAEIGPPERGSAIHRALERFIGQYPNALPDDAELELIAAIENVFRELGTPAATMALWMPRFIHAARYFLDIERKRRTDIVRSHIEMRGERKFAGPSGEFRLVCRADRLDELRSGGVAIVDYKTGKPPTGKQVNALLSPQMPLEGAILLEGGFAPLGKRTPEELLYIHFAGKKEPVECLRIDCDAAELSKEAAENLARRIAEFDDEAMPYISRVMVEKARAPGDYDHLARVREWSLTGWEESEE
ncbi:MAG TPA: double-strand break repair protein AddB [Rhizomicrobium sp.]|nr:double-strand break repair protein AddB [Rhizomicrobium sp.]